MKTKKILAPLVTAAMSGALLVSAPLTANAAAHDAPAPGVTSTVPAGDATIAPVAIDQTLQDGSTLEGTFTATQFVVENNQLVAEGVFTGTLTDANGVVTTITEAATSAVVTDAATNAACDILSLELGPLHLDLLGLVVDLDQVNLDITAEPGAGNLLGNLLCSVAGLLDNGADLGGLANLLNRLLGAL